MIDAPGLLSKGPGRVVGHSDDLGGIDYRKADVVFGELGLEHRVVADQYDVDSAVEGVNRAGDCLRWGVVAPHCVEGDTGQGSVGFHDLTAAVRAAFPTSPMWELGPAATITSDRGGTGHFPCSLALSGAGARHLLLGHRHVRALLVNSGFEQVFQRGKGRL